jgi:NAD(P)-dependent dehydrogenase (short-subunit alcohol dehydrogenase family)
MLFEFGGRTAVVIGGAGAIGSGVASGLAAAGMNVVVADVELDAATRMAETIAARGGKASACAVDATDRDSIRRVAEYACAQYGAIHLLSNNVGVALSRRLDEADENDWAWFHELSLMTIVRAVDELLPFLRAHGEPAHIVNTSSLAGLLVLPHSATGMHLGLYTTMKHAVVGYTAILRAELESEHIGVSVLCPGLVGAGPWGSSARNRPERFGGAFPAATPAERPTHTAMASEDFGPLVVAGIRANRQYIFSHTDEHNAARLQARFDAMMADLDAARSR